MLGFSSIGEQPISSTQYIAAPVISGSGFQLIRSYSAPIPSINLSAFSLQHLTSSLTVSNSLPLSSNLLQHVISGITSSNVTEITANGFVIPIASSRILPDQEFNYSGHQHTQIGTTLYSTANIYSYGSQRINTLGNVQSVVRLKVAPVSVINATSSIGATISIWGNSYQRIVISERAPSFYVNLLQHVLSNAIIIANSQILTNGLQKSAAKDSIYTVVPVLSTGYQKTISQSQQQTYLNLAWSLAKKVLSNSSIVAPTLVKADLYQIITSFYSEFIFSSSGYQLTSSAVDILSNINIESTAKENIDSTTYITIAPSFQQLVTQQLNRYNKSNVLTVNLSLMVTDPTASLFRFIRSARVAMRPINGSSVYQKFVLPSVATTPYSSNTLYAMEGNIGTVISADSPVHMILTMLNGNSYDLGYNTVFVISTNIYSIDFINDLNQVPVTVSWVVS